MQARVLPRSSATPHSFHFPLVVFLMKGCAVAASTGRRAAMTNLIAQSEIEQMSEQELRVKFYELFNALAIRQQTTLDCEEIRSALFRIQHELQKRRMY
jgi:hypothetical protein